jgi:CRP/FNR family cyclic AMP-dependent transcriptional regulator
MADAVQAVRSLASFGLFEGLDDTSRRYIDERCRWRRYRSGQIILDRDSTSREVFFVAEGAVRVVNYTMSGREVAFADVGVGEYFGELAAIDGLPRTAGVRAVADSLVGVLPGEAFLELLRMNAKVAFRILERLVHVIRSCDDRIMDLATLGAMQRVYAELLRIAVPDVAVSGLWVVRPCPTEREIASRAGTARETVARAIRQLRQAGLVRRKDRKLYIMDRKRLETITRALGSAGRA